MDALKSHMVICEFLHGKRIQRHRRTRAPDPPATSGPLRVIVHTFSKTGTPRTVPLGARRSLQTISDNTQPPTGSQSNEDMRTTDFILDSQYAAFASEVKPRKPSVALAPLGLDVVDDKKLPPCETFDKASLSARLDSVPPTTVLDSLRSPPRL